MYSVRRIRRGHHLRPKIGAVWEEVAVAPTRPQAIAICYPKGETGFIYAVIRAKRP